MQPVCARPSLQGIAFTDNLELSTPRQLSRPSPPGARPSKTILKHSNASRPVAQAETSRSPVRRGSSVAPPRRQSVPIVTAPPRRLTLRRPPQQPWASVPTERPRGRGATLPESDPSALLLERLQRDMVRSLPISSPNTVLGPSPCLSNLTSSVLQRSHKSLSFFFNTTPSPPFTRRRRRARPSETPLAPAAPTFPPSHRSSPRMPWTSSCPSSDLAQRNRRPPPPPPFQSPPRAMPPLAPLQLAPLPRPLVTLSTASRCSSPAPPLLRPRRTRQNRSQSRSCSSCTL